MVREATMELTVASLYSVSIQLKVIEMEKGTIKQKTIKNYVS